MSDQRPTPPNPLEDGVTLRGCCCPAAGRDDAKCERGLEALTHYRKAFNERLQEFTDGRFTTGRRTDLRIGRRAGPPV
jgi:hypothetical protein